MLVEIERIGLPAGRARHFELTAYDPAGQVRADCPPDGWVAVDIDLAHTHPQARCVELAYAGEGAARASASPLKRGCPMRSPPDRGDTRRYRVGPCKKQDRSWRPRRI